MKEKRNVLLLSDLKDIHTQGKAKCFVIVLSKSCFERITKTNNMSKDRLSLSQQDGQL